MDTRRIAIVGAGVAGLAAAYELHKQQIPFTLFEVSWRTGGIVETAREGGFILEGGPDGWVTEKPWLEELAIELGLQDELVPSNDAERVTYILRDGILHPIPDGMRMMVPTDLDALRHSSLFTSEDIQAFEEEMQRADGLRRYAEDHAAEDESVATFVRRHFGEQVTRSIAAPLLAGVFGGDVEQLSARSVMPQFVALEREYGSLILGLRERTAANHRHRSIFTTLRDGMGSLVDAMVRTVPPESLRMNTRVDAVSRAASGWTVTVDGSTEEFSQLILATPTHITRSLLASVDAEAAMLLRMDASSAVIVGMGFTPEQAASIPVPKGFGVLIPPGTKGTDLLASTFVDQKFSHRVPKGGRILRAFFGSDTAERMQSESEGYLLALAQHQLSDLLKTGLPEPAYSIVRRLPRSLPQYGIGHADRMRRLAERVALNPGLTLLGNAFHGVGLPDLIRDGRAAAKTIAAAQ